VPVLVLALVAGSTSLRAQSDGDLDPSYVVAPVGIEPALDLFGGVACGLNGLCYVAISHYTPSASFDFLPLKFYSGGGFQTAGLAAFDLGGTNDDFAPGVAVDASGRVVLAGKAEDGGPAGNDVQVAIARFVPGPGTLALDGGFSGDGKQTVNFVGGAGANAVAIAPDGKIVVAGCYDTGGVDGLDILVVRFDTSGTPDPGFDGNGIKTFGFNLGGGNTDCATAVAVQHDGKVVVAGYAQFSATDYDFAIARLDTAGALDPTFSAPDGMVTVAFDLGNTDEDKAQAIAIDHLGRIVVAGGATGNPSEHVAMVRLTRTGAIDSTFGTLTRFTGPIGEVASVAALSPPSRRILYLDSAGVHALTDHGQPDMSFSGDGQAPFDDPGGTAEVAKAMTLHGGRPVVTGRSFRSDDALIVMRYFMRQIFGDDFESGDDDSWGGLVW